MDTVAINSNFGNLRCRSLTSGTENNLIYISEWELDRSMLQRAHTLFFIQNY